jgi:hypothetical protein
VAAGATVVSNSWSGPEDGVTATEDEDAHYDHPGTAIFGCTGDTGANGDSVGMPATSPHVIAVGGTTLVQDLTAPRQFTESAWGGAGSICSGVFPQPSYQTGVVSACTTRAIADVSAVADPETGVAFFEQGQWGVLGGTSVATPVVAGIFVMTGHTAIAPDFIYLNPTDFNDVVSGANGACTGALCNAGSGWDGPTGIGTPIGALLNGAELPTLTVTPADGAQVTPGFDVDVTCTSNDAATITEVDIGIDGVELSTQQTPPFTQHIPASIADGPHTVFVNCKASSLAVIGTISNVTQAPADTGSGSGSGSGSDTTPPGHGGGGCATTGDTPTLPVALVVACVLSVAGGRPRARRRAARAPHPRRRPAP